MPVRRSSRVWVGNLNMASDKSQLDFVLDQIRSAGVVTAKAMFGEFGIYCDGKIVALFCDNQLFVKPTEGGRALIRNPVEAPPYSGAKPYFLIEDQIEDGEWMSELIKVTAQQLPMPREKSKAGRTAAAKKVVR
jgi:TfoX/Sxy family transcriptional regulator of competence genes